MNQVAIDFIKSHEGCRLAPYQDGAGVWTIGWGATGPDIKSGMSWTQQQADDRLMSDVAKFDAGVSKLLKRTLSDTSRAALVSFAFNLGTGPLASSHLLQCVNNGDDFGAARAFLAWDHIGQNEVKGLLIRRLEEAALFLRGL